VVPSGSEVRAEPSPYAVASGSTEEVETSAPPPALAFIPIPLNDTSTRTTTSAMLTARGRNRIPPGGTPFVAGDSNDPCEGVPR